MIKDRRDPAAFKLRTYIDAIRDAENTTDEQWMDQWVKYCNKESVYIPRSAWLGMLKNLALNEAKTLAFNKVA